jgi:quinol monooxygenase YgiN
MIQVVAILKTKPGMREQMLAAYRDNVAAVRAEDGCISYEAMIDVNAEAPWFAKFGPDCFVVVEKWASLDALKAHAAAPHMKAYGAKTKDWIAERAIHVLEPA